MNDIGQISTRSIELHPENNSFPQNENGPIDPTELLVHQSNPSTSDTIGPNRWRCTICEVNFIATIDLTAHIKEIHPEDNLVLFDQQCDAISKCWRCNCFINVNEIDNHVALHENYWESIWEGQMSNKFDNHCDNNNNSDNINTNMTDDENGGINTENQFQSSFLTPTGEKRPDCSRCHLLFPSRHEHQVHFELHHDVLFNDSNNVIYLRPADQPTPTMLRNWNSLTNFHNRPGYQPDLGHFDFDPRYNMLNEMKDNDDFDEDFDDDEEGEEGCDPNYVNNGLTSINSRATTRTPLKDQQRAPPRKAGRPVAAGFIRDPSRPYKTYCKKCKRYISTRILKRHSELHDAYSFGIQEGQFRCDACVISFDRSSVWSRHVAWHNRSGNDTHDGDSDGMGDADDDKNNDALRTTPTSTANSNISTRSTHTPSYPSNPSHPSLTLLNTPSISNHQPVLPLPHPREIDTTTFPLKLFNGCKHYLCIRCQRFVKRIDYHILQHQQYDLRLQKLPPFNLTEQEKDCHPCQLTFSKHYTFRSHVQDHPRLFSEDFKYNPETDGKLDSQRILQQQRLYSNPLPPVDTPLVDHNKVQFQVLESPPSTKETKIATNANTETDTNANTQAQIETHVQTQIETKPKRKATKSTKSAHDPQNMLQPTLSFPDGPPQFYPVDYFHGPSLLCSRCSHTGHEDADHNLQHYFFDNPTDEQHHLLYQYELKQQISKSNDITQSDTDQPISQPPPPLPQTWKCEYCSLSFHQKSHYNCHNELPSHHHQRDQAISLVSNSFYCLRCKMTKIPLVMAENHRALHHSFDHCDEMQRKTGLHIELCHQCQMGFDSTELLAEHNQLLHPPIVEKNEKYPRFKNKNNKQSHPDESNIPNYFPETLGPCSRCFARCGKQNREVEHNLQHYLYDNFKEEQPLVQSELSSTEQPHDYAEHVEDTDTPSVKRQGKHHKQAHTWRCEYCCLAFSRETHFDRHLDGVFHRAQKQRVLAALKPANTFDCLRCKMTNIPLDQEEDHLDLHFVFDSDIKIDKITGLQIDACYLCEMGFEPTKFEEHNRIYHNNGRQQRASRGRS